MSDNNNALAGQIPAEPYSALRSLDRLVGEWKATSSFLEGSMVFEWMEGGFSSFSTLIPITGSIRSKGWSTSVLMKTRKRSALTNGHEWE